ncbi:uncharacterized protein LOC129963392 [Argiope bruennichi]|uniref:Uncharacterized protein n=1 Tax=Argiope bruennichi TaxID=94029 RepID=A0A8T0F0K4_ARGBR|nr:uncharacterized protein LOC129963392 [Argiope bruennichi]KAF8782519.1 hypothetical protein HNY73_012791 [Argiope bruennichi]
MEAEGPDDRPESPKKKIRPSSTTNSEMLNSDNHDSTDSVEASSNHSAEMNGLAPTRRGREAEARENVSEASHDQGSIQEEVVSSSENAVQGKKQPPTESDGDADSLTNEAEDLNSHEAASINASCDTEAEKHEL